MTKAYLLLLTQIKNEDIYVNHIESSFLVKTGKGNIKLSIACVPDFIRNLAKHIEEIKI
jgi:hypothetical protein